MAYIFVDDGHPEADEYDNNYIWFDEDVPGARRDALERAQHLARCRDKESRFTWRHLLLGRPEPHPIDTAALHVGPDVDMETSR